MPKVPIIMPQLGESIAEATIVRFSVQPGDRVEADQEVIEVETSKAVMGVTTPCGGVIDSFSAQVEQTYPIGHVLGYIEASVEDAERLGTSGHAPAPSQTTEAVPQEVDHTWTPQSAPGPAETWHRLDVPVAATGAAFLSPRVKARLQEFGLHSSDTGVVPGTGSGGRVTIQDFEKYLEHLHQLPAKKASAMRLAVADSMRRSWTRPLATVGVSIPLEPILAHRKKITPSPGPALYVAKALALAIAENPQYAGRLVGDKLVLPDSIDIGVAVEVPDGVMVPVFPKLNEKALPEIADQYQKLLDAAKERRLPEEAKKPSVASVTNFGTLGITWGTPIPLPNETLIIGLGRGEKRPFWDEASDRFVPRIEAELTLSFDHRVIDGGQAGRLIQRMVELLATPESL
jgi:pyruvate/2-oxoglutarate dehydrogenase complex dihydrolipoamide acyltransferase (E2) component